MYLKLYFYDITTCLTSRLSSHWLWKERWGCLLSAVFNLLLCSFVMFSTIGWGLIPSCMFIACRTLVDWFGLPYLYTAQTNHCVHLSYWAAPSHSLVEHFLVPPTSYYVLKKWRDAVCYVFIHNICLIFNQLVCWQHLLAPFCITIFLFKIKELVFSDFPTVSFLYQMMHQIN